MTKSLAYNKHGSITTIRSPYTGRSPSYTMERGIAVLLNRIMTSLTYRGKTYTHNNSKSENSFVELTYRRNVYTNRKKDGFTNHDLVTLKYRGIEYTK